MGALGDSQEQLETLGNNWRCWTTLRDSWGLYETGGTLSDNWLHWAAAGDDWGPWETAGYSE